ncbi:MAG: glucose-6-phosphate dehydrogenase (NADP(+)) [Patescibacteria group bacterium]|nr:glucose-6-phosphate dehydrogenase (NADP(+)) [Patescibacteria group bacterium]
MQDNLPTTLIIFGATGDLMAKKIVPSLWHLFTHGTLPSGWRVVGISRRDLDDGKFRELVKEFLAKYGPSERNTADEARFFEMFSFARVAFESDTDFQSLAALLDEREKTAGPFNRLIYMAVPPDAFPSIFSHAGFGTIVKHGEEHGCHTHIIIEKPFGTDLTSAHALEAVLAKRFTEEQLYRADHYLAKPMLRNIPHFRFGSEHPLLEHLWNREHISKIHIRTLEPLGVESRGAFYDPLGTLRDVGQNHLLEILALLTMEPPASRDAMHAREARAAAIRALQPFADDDITSRTYRAQYDSYRHIDGVRPESDTETYYALTAYLNTPRWQGVPIVMEAGKRMAGWQTEAIVSFKDGGMAVFRMRPEEELVVTMNGEEKRIELPRAETTQQYVAEYARILMDAAKGDQTLFIDPKEIEACWTFIDPIEAGWEKGLTPLASYAPDTNDAANAAEKKLSVQ